MTAGSDRAFGLIQLSRLTRARLWSTRGKISETPLIFKEDAHFCQGDIAYQLLHFGFASRPDLSLLKSPFWLKMVHLRRGGQSVRCDQECE